MLNCLVVLESVVTRRGSDGRRRSADAELRPLAARLNTGGRDCPAGASFTAHIPTNRFLPTGCASSVPGMSIGAAADAMNRFFLSVPCPAPRGSGQFFGLAWASRGVQRHCVADESLEGGVVNFVAFVQVDGTPGVAFKAGVEELRRIPQLSTLGECQLDHVLVCLARADQPVVRPHRNASPLPLFGNPGVGLFYQGADPGERLAAPVAQLLDPRVYQPRW